MPLALEDLTHGPEGEPPDEPLQSWQAAIEVQVVTESLEKRRVVAGLFGVELPGVEIDGRGSAHALQSPQRRPVKEAG